MTDTTSSIDATRNGAGAVPQQRVTMPEFVDWHMILDSELDQLSRPETGVIGSVGFTTLGAVLGLLPSFFSALSKVGGTESAKLSVPPPAPLSGSDVAALIACAGAAMLALVCLALFAISTRRNSGIVARIRTRKQHGMPSAS